MFRRVLCVTSAVALLGGLATSSLSAMPTWNRATHFTFSGPVRVPGAVLTAGTYTFEFASPNNRHVVRVIDRKRTKVYTTAFAYPVERRADGNLEAAIVLGEAAPATPPAVKAWYPHGERVGLQFIY